MGTYKDPMHTLGAWKTLFSDLDYRDHFLSFEYTYAYKVQGKISANGPNKMRAERPNIFAESQFFSL